LENLELPFFRSNWEIYSMQSTKNLYTSGMEFIHLIGLFSECFIIDNLQRLNRGVVSCKNARMLEPFEQRDQMRKVKNLCPNFRWKSR
jgi:hypothetical protein